VGVAIGCVCGGGGGKRGTGGEGVGKRGCSYNVFGTVDERKK